MTKSCCYYLFTLTNKSNNILFTPRRGETAWRKWWRRTVRHVRRDIFERTGSRCAVLCEAAHEGEHSQASVLHLLEAHGWGVHVHRVQGEERAEVSNLVALAVEGVVAVQLDD